MGLLEEFLEAAKEIPPEHLEQAYADAEAATKELVWVPSPGPQTDAYISLADILLFGGEPGGGKTSLLLGLAFNCHQRSLLMRRQYTDLGAMLEEAVKLNGGRDGYNGSPPPRLRRPDGRLIDFGAAAKPADEQHWQGNPHDFLGVDEGAQFLRSQIRFLMGWVRSTEPGQRKRVVIATNPPMNPEGLWLIEDFAPWLDPRHPNPAKPKELRWFVTDEEGRDREVPGPQPVMIAGKLVDPMSRTFIPASVKDNPYLARTGYQKQLDAMIEPFRSILLGRFQNAVQDNPMQIIPTDWIRESQKRWTQHPPAGVPMCVLSIDASGGGQDPMTIGWRHDGWFSPIEEIPGKELPMDKLGRYTAGLVFAYRRDKAVVVIDLGGGYGLSAFEHIRAQSQDIEIIGYKGGIASTARTHDKQLGFANKRTEALWKFREALDPAQPGGSPILLPDDPKMVAELTAVTYEVKGNTIHAEPKEDVVERLGRSTDHGDNVIMGWSAGPIAATHGRVWEEEHRRRTGQSGRHAVVMGRPNARRRI